MSWNLGASNSWNPQGLSRPVMGLLYVLPFTTTTTTAADIQSLPSIPQQSNKWGPRVRSVQAISLRTVFSYSYFRRSVLHFRQLMLYVLARSVRLFEDAILFLCLHRRTIFVKYYKPTTCPPPLPRPEQLPTAASRYTLNEATDAPSKCPCADVCQLCRR